MPRRIILLLALTASCVASPPPAIRPNPEFDSYYTVLGRETVERSPASTIRYQLRTMIDKQTGAVTHQGYAERTYLGSWKNYDEATGAGGTPLRFVAITRESGDCTLTVKVCQLTEVFAVVLPDSLLRAHVTDGYMVQFAARGADKFVASFWPEDIRAQLDSVKARLRRERTGT